MRDCSDKILFYLSWSLHCRESLGVPLNQMGWLARAQKKMHTEQRIRPTPHANMPLSQLTLEPQ